VLAPGAGITILGNGTAGEQLWTGQGGGAAFTEVYQVGGDSQAGTITTTNTVLTQVVSFTGLAQIDDSVSVSELTVATPAGQNDVSILDASFPINFPAPVPAGATSVTAPAMTPILVADKSQVTVNGSAGKNTFFVDNPSAAAGLQILSVQGGGEGDNFNTVTTASNVITKLTGGQGNDVFNVGSLAPAAGGVVDLIAGPLVVNGGSGYDVLNVDDTGNSEAKTGTLTSTTLTGLNMAGGITYAALTNVNINLGPANYQFTQHGQYRPDAGRRSRPHPGDCGGGR
jgi:hypothetical protein